MTLIVGARCADGVVVVGDRKHLAIVDIEPPTYNDKIFCPSPDLLWGAAGTTGAFRKIRDGAENYIASRRNSDGSVGTGGFLDAMLQIVPNVNDRLPVDVRDQPSEVLVGLNDSRRGPTLIHIAPNGDHEEITSFRPIGSGATTGLSDLRREMRGKTTIAESVEAICYVIRLLERQSIDRGVGVGDGKPDIWTIRNGDGAKRLDDFIIAKIWTRVEKRVALESSAN